MSTHKIYSAWQRRREVPQVKLQGLWLAAAGLRIGSEIRVTVEPGRLVIETPERRTAPVAVPTSTPDQLAA